MDLVLPVYVPLGHSRQAVCERESRYLPTPQAKHVLPETSSLPSSHANAHVLNAVKKALGTGVHGVHTASESGVPALQW